MQNTDPMSPSGYQGAAVILISFGVFMAAILMTLSATGGPDSTPPSDAGEADLRRVYGLGVDPDTDALYIAADTGVFTFADERLERVADRRQNTRGFAVVGPGHLLAGGHPDPREDLPSPLGLIESVDGAETWQPLSLEGTADLHTIEPTADTTYAIESSAARLIASDDRREWRTVDERPLLDLAAMSTPGGNQLLATTPDGELLRYDTDDGAPLLVDDAPTLTYIDWAGRQLVGASPNGDIYTSTTGDDWLKVGAVSGEVEALETGADAWHLATTEGVFASTNAGESWTLIVEIA